MSTTYSIKINKLEVIKSESYGLFGEPGSTAEWRLRVRLYDGWGYTRTTWRWNRDGVDDNTVYYINAVTSMTTVGTGFGIYIDGYEHDSTSPNDYLPSAWRNHSNVDYGKSFSLSASNSDFSYVLSYVILDPAAPLVPTLKSKLSLDQVLSIWKGEGLLISKEMEGRTELHGAFGGFVERLCEYDPGLRLEEINNAEGSAYAVFSADKPPEEVASKFIKDHALRIKRKKER